MLDRKATAQERPAHVGTPRRIRAAISVERATDGLAVGRLRVTPEQVVFVKGIIEASEGLAGLFAERGGDLCIAAPPGRAEELRELLLDLAADLGGTVDLEAPHDQGAPHSPPLTR